jgi:hypothetical protein
MSSTTTDAFDKQFKNVFAEQVYNDRAPERYHAADVLTSIWKPKHFPNLADEGFKRHRYISHEMAVFMGITHNPPHATIIECTNAVNKYIKEHKLQDPTNTRHIIPDMILSMLFGPLNEKDRSTGYTYFNLQTYLSKHYLPGRVACNIPEYRPSTNLTNFIKTTALPYLDDASQVENDDNYVWDMMDFKNKTPVEDELATVDAVAPTVVLDYILSKNLQKVVVTVAYDKPLFDMLGKTEADTVTYDDLAEILRAKMYPELAAGATGAQK